MGYGVLRFFVEGLRTDSLYVFGLRTAQLVSIGFVIVGIGLFSYANKKDIRPFRLRKRQKEKEDKIIRFD